jgi:putative membrane protein
MQRSHRLIASALVAGIALVGPIPELAHSSFTAHMVQHLLLTLVAGPLFASGAPAVGLLRATHGASRRRLAAVFRSRTFRSATHPVVAWLFFALVMWVSHFSPLYQLALDNELVHVAEHGLYLAAGALFWTPVMGADPITRRRLSWPARLGYLVAALPMQSFLGLALYSSTSPLYEAYPDLDDQRTGALVMWLGGDFVFVIALALTVGAWMRADRAEAIREERLAGLGT